MQTLSYGYKLTETGDFGDVWFTALEDNITRINTHSHNGTDSSNLTSLAIKGVHQTVVSGDFSVFGSGFRATVTLPASIVYDDYVVQVKDSSGHIIMLTVEKINDTSFYLLTNTQQDYEVYFLS